MRQQRNQIDERNFYLLEKGVSTGFMEEMFSIQQIEEMAFHRMKVIKEILSEEQKSHLEEREINYENIIQKNKFDLFLDNQGNNYKKEIISHFLCKMGYAFSEQPEEWENYAKAETIIFYEKIKKSQNKINEYFTDSDLKIEPVTKEIYNQASKKINSIFHISNFSSTQIEELRKDYEDNKGIPGNIFASSLFKVKFTGHPSLLKLPTIVLHKGYIIMRKIDKKLVLQNIFHQKLIKEMTDLKNVFQNKYQEELPDERLVFIKKLSKAEVCDFVSEFTNSSSIKASEVDRLAKTDMPPCMIQLVEGLNKNNHLKHFGRLQLGLFLKGAGLNLSEAIHFWSQKFSKVTADDFKKRYEYNIKHNYGKLGKQQDYTPMSCQKIISQNPLNDEYHGCPFKTLDNKKMEAFLKLYFHLKDDDITEIMNQKKAKFYQLACRELFKSKFNTKNDQVDQGAAKIGNHPNIFFEQSLRIREPNRFVEIDEKRKKNKQFQSQQPHQNNESKMDIEF